jgi:hypothetical protein
MKGEPPDLSNDAPAIRLPAISVRRDLLLLGDPAGLLRSLLHCALRLLLRFLSHIALRFEMASSLRAFGNRNARHSEYTNTSKKNIVPLKEVLTCRHDSMRTTSIEERVRHAQAEAKNLRAGCVSEAQDCKKRLCRSRFCESHFDRWRRARSESASLKARKAGVVDSESFNFARKIFS